MIIPMGADREYPFKKEVIYNTSKFLNVKVNFPIYNYEEPDFNLNAAISIVKKVDFIIADLSLERPSCYYELGMAEVLNKKIYLIATEGTEIHQTSHRSSVFFYKNISSFERLVKTIIKKELTSNFT